MQRPQQSRMRYGSLWLNALCSIRKRENIPVFRANHHIHRHILTKTFVHTFKLYTGKTH